MSGDWSSPAKIARLQVAVAAMPEPRRSVYTSSLAMAVADLVRALDDDDGPLPALQ